MKKTVCVILCVSLLPLSGCGGLYENYRDVERLLVVDTMGLDRIPGGVKLSFAAAGTKQESDPELLTGTGENIERAAEQIRRLSFEEDLFLKHTDFMLFGEEAAKSGLSEHLAYLCSSQNIRMDLPLYIVREGEAAALMRESGGEDRSISEILQGIGEYFRGRGDGHVFTVREVERSLLKRDSALVCALKLSPASETTEDEAKTAEFDGYAVLKGGRLLTYLDREQAVGVGFLTGNTGVCSVTVRDPRGASAELHLNTGSCTVTPVWGEDGALRGLQISARVLADVTELHGGGSMSSSVYVRQLTGLLEETVAERINAVLRLSAELRIDLAGLAEEVERAAPEKYAKLASPFEELLPTLETQVSVSAVLSHGSDLKGGAA